MTKIGEEANKKSVNGYRENINGSLCLIMEERIKKTKGLENGSRGKNN